MSKYFKIIASSNAPLPSDWPTQLVSLLGSKPRRLSRWCELGLFGALSCIREASAKQGSDQLSDQLKIRVYTEYSTILASRQAIGQSQEHLPMPFTFMQTQPGQLLNALGAAIGWHGDGLTMAGRNRQETEIELLQTLHGSALLGWVDEVPEAISRWIWLESGLESAEGEPGGAWETLPGLFETHSSAKWLQLRQDGALFQI